MVVALPSDLHSPSALASDLPSPSALPSASPSSSLLMAMASVLVLDDDLDFFFVYCFADRLNGAAEAAAAHAVLH